MKPLNPQFRRAQNASVWLLDNATELRRLMGPTNGGVGDPDYYRIAYAVTKVVENLREIADLVAQEPRILSHAVQDWDEARVRTSGRHASLHNLIKHVANIQSRLYPEDTL